MKLCRMQGCGVCLGCSHIPPEGYGDVCRYEAETLLDLLFAFLDTELTYNQEQILTDFEIVKDDTE